MYVITGASGNTGSAAARTLLDKGKQVRVIARHPERLQQFASQGAQVAAGDLTNTKQLAEAFRGATAVYLMIPPSPAEPDTFAYDERLISSFVSALKKAHVSHAVVLSSIGADKESGTGPVLGLRRLEQALDQVSGLNVLHLRAGYFMENTLGQVPILKSFGSMGGPVRPDLKLPMIAAHDIGVIAAQALLSLDFKGHLRRELHGQRDVSYSEVASIVGKAIGKPDLKYSQLPDEQLRPALAKAGMSENFITLLLEMTRSLNSGHMRALEPRSSANTTPTSYETFVAEKFLPAYRRLAATAGA